MIDYTIAYTIANALIIIFAALFISLLFHGIERKIVARMQARIGPPLLQPFIDIKKLFMKENIVPDSAVKWLFNLMPIVALSSAIVLFLYIPFGMPAILNEHGDLILVLYLLSIPPLALAIGAFASGSSFAAVGAQRELVLLISYEFVLSVVIFSFAWLLSVCTQNTNVFSLNAPALNPPWSLVGPIGFIGIALLLISTLAVMPGKAGKIPADIAEAKTEIAEGVLVEYSGFNLALLYMTQAVRTFGFAALIVALFFPWNASIFIDIPKDTVLEPIFFILKAGLVMFFSAFFISAAVARFKVDQAARFYISTVFSIALLGLLLILLDLTLRGF